MKRKNCLTTIAIKTDTKKMLDITKMLLNEKNYDNIIAKLLKEFKRKNRKYYEIFDL